jgi:hypothetical protein
MKKNAEVDSAVEVAEEVESSGLEGYTMDCDLVGTTQLGFGAPFQTDAKSLEGGEEELEQKHWRERILVNEETGNAMINPMALKKALDQTAKKQLGTVPGKGKCKYGGYFKSGVMVVTPIDLGVKPDKINPERMFVALPGQGRHWKNFPKLPKWNAHATIAVLDGIVKPDVLEKCLNKCGNTNGLGLFRPQNGGYWGRFVVKNIKVRKN